MVSATGSIPTFSEPFGIAAGPGGVVYFANVTGSTLTKMTSTTAGTNFGSATSLNNPSYVAVDGSGNVWVSDKNSSPGTVSEFSSTGTVLSPTPVSPAITPVGFVHAGLTSAQGIAIDPSGNVWVANNVASTGGVFEIVGAAAPTVTPIALALKNGAVGAKP
jgi:streptogramin lyase